MTQHFHRDEDGILRKCYHTCRNIIFAWQFWLGMTLSFPFEHMLWEKVPGFSNVSHWLGL